MKNSGMRGNGHVDYKGIKAQSTLREMLSYVFGSVLKRKGLLILNIAFLTLIAVLEFFIPQFTSNIINNVVDKGTKSYLVHQIILMLGSVLLMGALNFGSQYLMQILSQTSITELRLKLYNFILKQDFSFFEKSKTGDLMTRMTGDISNLQQLISGDTFGIIGNIFTFFAVLGFLFWKNWQLALLISLTFPILFFTIRFFRAKMTAAFNKVRANQSEISNQLQSTLTQVELIKNYTTENAETKTFNKIVNEGNKYQLEATTWGAILSPTVTFINQIGLGVVLYIGGSAVLHHTMNIGELVAYTQYLTLLQNPIRSFSQIINRIQNAQISYDRIRELIGIKPKVVDIKNPKKFPDPLEKGIKLKRVKFQYEPGNKWAVNNVSFDIPVGKTTALVGRSGSGKSTIIKLLTRMYDRDSGEINYDDLDIKDIEMSDLRKHISVVSQDVTIVDGTIAENIKYGTPNATEKDVWTAAKLADIDSFIKGLKNGLKTQVGERGVKLSGGQKQRISIARALLKNAPIVILDEATAALDNESEKSIQNALDNLLVKKTSIVIAHRLSTVHKADQIVVLNNGKIAEIGTHTELLKKKNGQYKKLYDAQFE